MGYTCFGENKNDFLHLTYEDRGHNYKMTQAPQMKEVIQMKTTEKMIVINLSTHSVRQWGKGR